MKNLQFSLGRVLALWFVGVVFFIAALTCVGMTGTFLEGAVVSFWIIRSTATIWHVIASLLIAMFITIAINRFLALGRPSEKVMKTKQDYDLP